MNHSKSFRLYASIALLAVAAAILCFVFLNFAGRMPLAGDFGFSVLSEAEPSTFLEAEMLAWKKQNPATPAQTSETPAEQPTEATQSPAEIAEFVEPAPAPEELMLKNLVSLASDPLPPYEFDPGTISSFGRPPFDAPEPNPRFEPNYPVPGSVQEMLTDKFGTSPNFSHENPDDIALQEIAAIYTNDLRFSYSDRQLKNLGKAMLLGTPISYNNPAFYSYSTMTYANCVDGNWYYASTAHSVEHLLAESEAVAFDADEFWTPEFVCTKAGVFGKLGSTAMLHDFVMEFGNPHLGEAYVILIPETPQEVVQTRRSAGPRIYKIQITGMYTKPADGKNYFTYEFDDPGAHQFGAQARPGMSGSPIFQADEQGSCFKFVGAVNSIFEGGIEDRIEGIDKRSADFFFNIAIWSYEMGHLQQYIVNKYYLDNNPAIDLTEDITSRQSGYFKNKFAVSAS